MAERSYEIVVFGATGFTGGIVAYWLATQFPDLRWALAGRDLAKLETVRAGLSAEAPHCAQLPLLEADTSDPNSLLEIARSTRVLLTTVGPYLQYGAAALDACVEAGTDYVDLTGEPEFVASSIRKHHETASSKGLRIVSCCGFDSIPPDLGAWFNVQQLPRQAAIRCEGYVRTRGNVSGGTWNTALEAMSRPQKGISRGLIPHGHNVRARMLGHRLHRAPLGGYAVPLPTIDPMVVLRSAQLLGYGPDFNYGHYAHVKTKRYLVGGVLGVGLIAGFAQIGPIRQQMKRWIPPGTGPNQRAMDHGWMTVTHIGTEGDRTVRTRISWDKDAGYLMTARMIASCALCLARDRDTLSHQVGVITPVAAMAEALVPRLKHAGFRFEVLD